jgi:LAO/AO transport system kinase
MELAPVLAGLEARDPAAVGRAISLVENGRAGFEELLSAIHHRLGRARRIGITGPPGAGKSTLTEQLVRRYRALGLPVAVVAVDPTSPFTGGALLGDRLRMERVALDPGVFIRSMATRGSLGGLATATREVCDVLDAAGFGRILIETVGVGQSELDVARTADSTVVVLVPESGDAIQTLKAGIMEIADLFVVNKADRPGADRLRQDLEVTLGIRAGHAFRHVPAHHGARGLSPSRGADQAPAGWTPRVLATVASTGEGVDTLVTLLDTHHAWLEGSGELTARRRRRLVERTREVLTRAMARWVSHDAAVEQLLQDRLAAIEAGRASPYEVAAEAIELLRPGSRV